MPTRISVILFLLFVCTFDAAQGGGRRILHQPFQPQGSNPIPPSPPVYPFSPSTSQDSPFFPTFPPPPTPPSPASFSSFPANIPSLSVPTSAKTKSSSSKLVAAAIAAVAAAVIILCLAVILHVRQRKRAGVPRSYESKIQRSYSDVHTAFDNAPNNHGIPKLQRPSQTSSEFLYLGTLVNSHAVGSGIVLNGSSESPAKHTNDSSPRKMDSPELRPLPPLVAQRNSQQIHHGIADLDSSQHDEDEDEEFYSPKGSLNSKESLVGTGSASRIPVTAVEFENYDGSSSSTYSSSVTGSGSGSPVLSVTLSTSPANSLSSINSIPKSSDLIEIQTDLPLNQNNMESSPSQARKLAFSSSATPSQSYSSSPEKYSTDRPLHPPPPAHSPVSSPSPSKAVPFSSPPPLPQSLSLTAAPPPAPPPPPQWKLEDSPRTPTPPVKKPPLQPPVLMTSLRPFAVDSPTSISPFDLPSNNSETWQNEDEIASLNGCKNKSAEPNEETTPKPKLKPLHWDKVRASSDKEMVWDQLKSSSFKLNEKMIETLFVVNASKPHQKEITKWQVLPTSGHDNSNRILDPKKAQNIAILMRALNVTVEEVCEGLLEGNSEILSTELLESLMKMAPTKEEEWKLKDHKDDSPIKLMAAEKFLKTILEIPYAFKRVDSMLYASNFESEKEYLERSFETLEIACEELRSSRMFLKLLEAVLKTGNRMNVGTNRGDAHAFKLDTLLKLVDIKGADGKTTLLHFVVLEIIRSEGTRLCCGLSPDTSIVDDAKCRKLGLQVVASISSELSNVKKAAAMDADVLSSEVSNLSKGIQRIREVVKLNEGTSHKFADYMNSFIKKAEEDIIRIQAQESVALSLVKELTEYFHGNSAKEEAHPFRIFMVVRDFIAILDRVCKEVGSINERTTISSADKFPIPVNPMLHRATEKSDDQLSPNHA